MRNTQRFFNNHAKLLAFTYTNQSSFLGKIVNPVFSRSMRLRFKRTLSYCQPIQDKTVVDLGCGPGHYAIALAQKGAKKVVGIDFAEEMIKIANQKALSLGLADRCRFIVQDIHNYSPKETFDYAIAMGVTDYTETPESVIAKVLELAEEKAFLSFPASGGWSALRKVLYWGTCSLSLYNRDQLIDLLGRFSIYSYEIEKLNHDYFVVVAVDSRTDNSSGDSQPVPGALQ